MVVVAAPATVTPAPPKTAKLVAVPRLIELPKAGITAATAITNQIHLCRIFSVTFSVSAALNFNDCRDDKRPIGA